MIWVSFAVGFLVGGMGGGLVMALVSATGRASEEERVAAAYRDGRHHERRVLGLPLRVDQHRPAVKH
jgi:ribose 5-phosphate isomerase RpiB